jgi:hypothetical protein
MEIFEEQIYKDKKIDFIIENKFNLYHRDIDYEYIWNKFKIATCVLIEKHPEYIKEPHNEIKLTEITNHIWSEGLKLMPDQYQLIINMDIHSHMIMWKDICDIISELSNSNKS